MSNKENDNYLEHLSILEEDLKDANKSYEQAKIDTHDNYEWEQKQRKNVEDLQNRLLKLKSMD